VCKTDSSIEKATATKNLVAQRTSVVEARTTVAQKELSVSFGGKLTHAGKSVDAQVLVDSGATHSFIHQKILDRNQWKGKPLEKPFNVLNADGSTNQAGKITQELRLPLTIGTTRHYETFYVSNTGRDDIILGMTWLQNYNPRID
jgi:predicted aspartyl protease